MSGFTHDRDPVIVTNSMQCNFFFLKLGKKFRAMRLVKRIFSSEKTNDKVVYQCYIKLP